jgi:hypothetical protein
MKADNLEKQNLTNCVLRCDILPLSGHIRAAPTRFVVWVLMNSGDNDLGSRYQTIWAAAVGFAGRDCEEMSGDRTAKARVKGALLVSALGMSALVLSALTLGGCSISIADLPLAGTPADAPPRPKDASGYLPVNELPPEREESAMNAAERARIQSELVAARERQASAVAGKDAAAK